jgi:hypothetical protein
MAIQLSDNGGGYMTRLMFHLIVRGWTPQEIEQFRKAIHYADVGQMDEDGANRR